MAKFVIEAVDVSAIRGMPGKANGDYYVIKCPFHSDANPSCSVKMRPPYQGFFKCWSCSAKGPFKKLADKLGIDTRAKATPDLYPEEYADMFVHKGSSYEEDDEDVAKLYPLTDKNASKLGILENGWRGFDVDFLRDVVDAKVIDSRTLYFPVMVRGVEEGYIRALVTKPTVKGKPSYLNKRGAWSRNKGLFLFDQALAIENALYEKLKVSGYSRTVVLVEGPRDAMRLHLSALPGIAILGTQSWSEGKIRLLAMAGVDNVILCMDGDSAGATASHDIAESLDGYLNVYDFALHEWAGEYDPFNMPEKLLNRLIKLYNTVSVGVSS